MMCRRRQQTGFERLDAVGRPPLVKLGDQFDQS